jgi:hypothetical protein
VSAIRAALINRKANACPMAVRLAWHASGTFDKADGSGGSDGATMRFEPESTDDANAGLGISRDMMHRVASSFPDVAIADIWTLAGALAIEYTGGPKINHVACRTDAADNSGCPPNGRLPDAAQGAQHLRDVFYRQGFNDQEIVALSGAHTLGRCHLSRSGFDGPWTTKPLVFDNEYFTNLLEKTWAPSTRTGEGGNFQYEDTETKQLMMLPTDIALRDDAEFRPWVEKYAADEELFKVDFKAAMEKLISNGTSGCPATAPSSPGSAEESQAEANAEFREQAMHGSLAKVQELFPKVDAQEAEPGSGRTALHKAAFWGHHHLMAILIGECKIAQNVKDFNGDTALHDAARFGHATVVEELIKAGADKSIKNNEGSTALDLATEYNKADVAALLA